MRFMTVGRSMLELIVTCEHGGRDVPAEYRALFADEAALHALASHRGCDDGAADVARALAKRWAAPLYVADTTRLLVDLNRSIRHRGLFSELSRSLAAAERARVLERYYRPYRNAVEAAVTNAVRRGPVLHVSAHSFTPVLDGSVRRADIGLLFDPRRAEEAACAAAWRAALRAALPEGTVIRRNYPYRGVADGFTTALRMRFPGRLYRGIELEVNQRCVGRKDWPAYSAALADSLESVLASCDTDGRLSSRA